MAKKIYHKIGEVCKLVDIQPFVLRYWETEFPFLAPSKNKSGHRTYRQVDIDLVNRIKALLYDEGYTVPGARKKLETEIESGGLEAAARGAVAETASVDSGGSKENRSVVDTKGAKELKKLRSGIEGALGQAREILTLLEPAPPAASES